MAMGRRAVLPPLHAKIVPLRIYNASRICLNAIISFSPRPSRGPPVFVRRLCLSFRHRSDSPASNNSVLTCASRFSHRQCVHFSVFSPFAERNVIQASFFRSGTPQSPSPSEHPAQLAFRRTTPPYFSFFFILRSWLRMPLFISVKLIYIATNFHLLLLDSVALLPHTLHFPGPAFARNFHLSLLLPLLIQKCGANLQQVPSGFFCPLKLRLRNKKREQKMK